MHDIAASIKHKAVLLTLFVTCLSLFLPTGALAQQPRTSHVTMLYPDKPSAVIAVPGGKLGLGWCYDIASLGAGRLFLSNDTMAQVSEIETSTRTLLPALGAGMFQGPTKCESFDFSRQGPNGNVVVGDRLFAGDGASDVRVFNWKTGHLLKTILTGNTTNKRADEMNYDPEHNLVFVTNGSDSPPFLSWINTQNYHVSKLVFSQASGLAQPLWDAQTGFLYLAVMGTHAHPGGEIDAFRVKAGMLTLMHVYPVSACAPSSLAIGNTYTLALGCGSGENGILDLNTGAILRLQASIGADVVATYPNRGLYYFTSLGTKVPQVTITNRQGTILQVIATDAGAHSLAVIECSGTLYIPEGSLGGVAVYHLKGRP